MSTTRAVSRDLSIPAVWRPSRSPSRPVPPGDQRHVADGKPSPRSAVIDSAPTEATVLLRHMSIGLVSSFDPRSVVRFDSLTTSKPPSRKRRDPNGTSSLSPSAGMMTYTNAQVSAAMAAMEKYRAADDSEVGAALVVVVGLSAERAAKEANIRDDMIRVARRSGASLRQLAEVSGLSRRLSAIVSASASTQ
jgi:hypothetical protein